MQLKQLLPLALASAAMAQSNQNLTEALNGHNDTLSVLNNLLAQNPSIVQAVDGMQNITVLAPNNDALNSFISSAGSSLSDSGAISALLTYHVLNGNYTADSFPENSMFIPTMLKNSSYANVTNGQRVEARRESDTVMFLSALKQSAKVVTKDIQFNHGTIHIIDSVLDIPMNDVDTLNNANLTSASGALQSANLQQTVMNLRDITIFAPDNEAFNAIGNIVNTLSTVDLGNILSYHVIQGGVRYSDMFTNQSLQATDGQTLKIEVINGDVFVNAAKVTMPNLLVSNGVVHVINQVLNPSNTTATPDPNATNAPAPAYSGASTASGVPFTSGVTTQTTTTFPAATSGPAATATAGTGSAAAAPIQTGAIGVAALFGGAALLANI